MSLEAPACPSASVQCVLQAYRPGLQWVGGEEGRTRWCPNPSPLQQRLENKWRMAEMHSNVMGVAEPWILGRMVWEN